MHKAQHYWAELLFIVLTIGGLVFMLAGSEDIVKLTPLYLVLNLALLTYRFGWSKNVAEILGIAAVIGFLAELIGVKTGLLFGDYIYGSVLGPKIFDVPLMVGVMWALVMSVVWAILPKQWGVKRIPAAATLAVLYDLVLEHFATRFDLWTWAGSIPLSNYIGWLIVASVIAAVYHYKDYMLHKTPLALYTLPAHIVFFLFSIL